MVNLFDLFRGPEHEPEPTEEEKFKRRLQSEKSLSTTAKAILANIRKKEPK